MDRIMSALGTEIRRSAHDFCGLSHAQAFPRSFVGHSTFSSGTKNQLQIAKQTLLRDYVKVRLISYLRYTNQTVHRFT